MKFFGDFNFLKKGSLLYPLFQFFTNANQDTEVTVEGQFAYNTDEKAVIFHDGTAVRMLVSKEYVDSLVTNQTLPPAPFDAGAETAFPTAQRRHIVTVAGVINGVTLQVNDFLVPAVDEPTDSASDWIIVQGNMDKATLAEVAAGVDDIKYITSFGLEHFRATVLANDYANMAGDGIAWNGIDSQFLLDLATDSGLEIDGDGKVLVKIATDLAWESVGVDYKIAVDHPLYGQVNDTGANRLFNFDKLSYLDASGIVTEGGLKPAFTRMGTKLIYSERDASYLYVDSQVGSNTGETVPAENITGGIREMVWSLGLTDLVTGSYLAGTSPINSQATYFNITDVSQAENSFLQTTPEGLRVGTSSLNSPKAYTFVSAQDAKNYIDSKTQSATPRIAFHAVTTVADTWTAVPAHNFDLSNPDEVFVQVTESGQPVVIDWRPLDKDTIEVHSHSVATLKVGMFAPPA